MLGFIKFVDSAFEKKDKPPRKPVPGLHSEAEEYQKHNVFRFENLAIESRYQAKYRRKNSKKYKYKMEKAEILNIYRIKPSKIARILTYIDLKLYKHIDSMELVNYKGLNNAREVCETFFRFKSKNLGLRSMVSEEISLSKNFYFFYRVCKELLKLNNYNSLDLVVSGIRACVLKKKHLFKIIDLVYACSLYENYRIMLRQKMQENQFVIPRFDMILKDIQESNLVEESEIISIKFCKVVEVFAYVQSLELGLKIKNMYEHFIVNKVNKSNRSYINQNKKGSNRAKPLYFLVL